MVSSGISFSESTLKKTFTWNDTRCMISYVLKEMIVKLYFSLFHIQKAMKASPINQLFHS